MIEHKKIYSNTLYKDAIIGRVEYLKELLQKDVKIDIQKQNNDMYLIQLIINDIIIYNICDTIDCCYRLIDGYYRAIYDSKKYNII